MLLYHIQDFSIANLNIKWTPNADTGGVLLTGYRVELKSLLDIQ